MSKVVLERVRIALGARVCWAGHAHREHLRRGEVVDVWLGQGLGFNVQTLLRHSY